MAFIQIPKQDEIPAVNPTAMVLKHIEYYPPMDGVYEGEEITEALIAKILREIPEGIEIYLSLDPYGEDDILEVLCDREWLALAFISGNDCCYSWNAAYADTDALTPLESGGQSPVEKRTALRDIEAGVRTVEYFIRTGALYPGIDWAKEI